MRTPGAQSWRASAAVVQGPGDATTTSPAAIASRAIGSPRDDDRPVAVAEGRAVRKEEVAVGQARVRVEGDGGDGELSRHRAAVQRLDVGELVREREALGVDAPLGERVEHERVVGVGAVRDGDGLGGSHGRILSRGDARARQSQADATRRGSRRALGLERRGGRGDLTCVPANATMKSRAIARKILVPTARDASKMKSPDGLRPNRRFDERMTHQSFGSDRLKAIRPFTGAEKLASRPKAVNWLSGGR